MRPGNRSERNGNASRFRPYHRTWFILFMAWMMCYIDRTITGPVVSWMIDHDTSFVQGAAMPHALAGIIGSMFFAGYMLTQFPAGALGDRYGRKVMVVISTAWAGIATMASGLVRSLNMFIVLRVLTGLGEGAYYSNDRALVIVNTPKEKVGLGMGVVFVGLAAGMTLATVLTPSLIDMAGPFMGENAWSFPFIVFSIPTMIVSFLLLRYVKEPGRGNERYGRAALSLLGFSALFLAVIMFSYLMAVELDFGLIWQTIIILIAVLVLVTFIFVRSNKIGKKGILSRPLLIMYFSAIPILYTLWFFAFWALLLVKEAGNIGLSGAAVYAGLFGLANAIGYPMGGLLCDRFPGLGRRKLLYSLGGMIVALLVMSMLPLVQGTPDPYMLGVLLFLMGIVFSAIQTVHMTMTADLAPEQGMASTFGMWNLIAEIGAVLSPVISGALRDLTGNWDAAIIVVAVLVIVSSSMVLLVPCPKDELCPIRN